MTPSKDRLALVLDLARQVTARRRLDDVLTTTFACLRPIMGFTGGSIQLLDTDGWIRLAASDPPAPPHVLSLRIPLGSSVGGRIILTEQPVYVADVLADESVPADRRQANLSRGVRSYLGVPLVADGRAIGLLQIDAPQADAWDEEERLLLSSVAPVVAAAIQNARAYEVRGKAFTRLAADDQQRERARRVVTGELAPSVAALQSVARPQDHELNDPVALAGRLARCQAAARRLANTVDRLDHVLDVELADDARDDEPSIVAGAVSGAG